MLATDAKFETWVTWKVLFDSDVQYRIAGLCTIDIIQLSSATMYTSLDIVFVRQSLKWIFF